MIDTKYLSYCWKFSLLIYNLYSLKEIIIFRWLILEFLFYGGNKFPHGLAITLLIVKELRYQTLLVMVTSRMIILWQKQNISLVLSINITLSS